MVAVHHRGAGEETHALEERETVRAGDAPTEKSSSASVPKTFGFFSPIRTLTSGRGGRRARHQSGTRTIRPAASSAGIDRSKRYASAAVHARG
jgi:hypothetical protein